MSALVLSIASYDYFAQDLARHLGIAVGNVERKRFPDGEHYLRLVDDVNDCDVILVGGTIDDTATMELYDLACAAVEYGARTLTLVVPWFGYSTMERAVLHGEAVIAKTRARLISSIPRPKLGSAVLLLDLHSEGIPHYFEGTIRPFHVYAKPLIERTARELAGSDFILGATDAGRAKWVESLANDLRVQPAFVYKRRHSAVETEVTAISRNLDGETVVIYDDMIRTGGSLMNAARAYRDAGAGKIIAITTHGVFPGDSLRRVVDSGLFARVACTDSHPNARALAGADLTVHSAAELFVPLLGRTI
ncbi:MAG TPA: ribose-phosphate diphosphokinase [Thermoanaerobaculia bacterium]